MRGDDRLMTVLTGIVLTVALGVVAQRIDIFSDGEGVSPRDDVVTLAAGKSYLIDVVANDLGTSAGDGERILIIGAPDCGRVNRREGMLAYHGRPGCAGTQRLSYCLAEADDCLAAQVTLIIDDAASTESSASGTPLMALAEGAEDPAALAAVSPAPESSGFTPEPAAAAARRGPLAALTSAFGSLAPPAAETEAPAPEAAR